MNNLTLSKTRHTMALPFESPAGRQQRQTAAQQMISAAIWPMLAKAEAKK